MTKAAVVSQSFVPVRKWQKKVREMSKDLGGPVSLGGIYQGESNLTCPHCGNNYLHHGEVTVFFRNEDEPLVVVTRIEGGSASVDVVPTPASGNPSSRRDGLTVNFWCEGCGRSSELTIAQHKGISLLAWREPKQQDNFRPLNVEVTNAIFDEILRIKT